MKRTINLFCVALLAAAMLPTAVFAEIPQGAVAATPAEYKFTLEGDTNEYILLEDDPGSASSRFFVLKETRVQGGGHSVTAWGGGVAGATVAFDPAIPGTLAALLNPPTGSAREYWNDFSAAFLPYIDKNHLWEVEAGSIPAYHVMCGITLLSRAELLRHIDKIGYSGLSQSYWLRTPASGINLVLAVSVADGNIVDTSYGGTRNVRPCFWLSSEFFSKVRLEPGSVGEEVKKILQRNYVRADLSGLYTPEELDALGVTGPEYYLKTTVADGTLSVEVLNRGAASMLPEVITVLFAAYDAEGDYLKSDIHAICPEREIPIPPGEAYASKTFSYTLSGADGAVLYKSYIVDHIFGLRSLIGG
ncbi:MAG: hypothetical protein LBH54_06280 [Clostridiales bacterium]|jgi:hypothetical protein|nr:hypothetical protein [Clostridiales bacterium]